MAKATYVGDTRTKNTDSNQKSFEKMIVMRYDTDNLGTVKMTVGIKNRSHEKVEYSITVPDIGTQIIDDSLRIKSKGKRRKKRLK